MLVNVDKAGRLVIPKELRDAVGIVPGPVDLHVVGNALQIEVPADEPEIVEKDGMLMIRGGTGLSLDELRDLRMLQQDPLRGRGDADD